MIGLVYGELPFMILPLYASLEKLDRSLLEAAADLGAGRAASFWRVTVPLSLPGIVAGMVLVFIPSLGQFVVSDLLGGARSMLLGNLIQNQFAVARNKPFGSALAFELTAAVLVLLLAYALLREAPGRGGAAVRSAGAIGTGASWRPTRRSSTSSSTRPSPSSWSSLSTRPRQTAFWEGFTLDWYRRLLDNALLFRSVRNSLLVAGITTVVAVLLGTPAALALARWTRFPG